MRKLDPFKPIWVRRIVAVDEPAEPERREANEARRIWSNPEFAHGERLLHLPAWTEATLRTRHAAGIRLDEPVFAAVRTADDPIHRKMREQAVDLRRTQDLRRDPETVLK